MEYQLTLTAAEINLIKRALDAYEQPLTDKANKYALRNSVRCRAQYNMAKKELSNTSDLYQKVSEQLSDQQPDFTPLSQREYPQ